MHDVRRSVPATGTLLALPAIDRACRRVGRGTVLAVIREVQQQCRDGELAGDDVEGAVMGKIPRTSGGLHPVINATGVIVHTNLGRAPLSAAAIEAVVTAAGATDVELDLETGTRGRRGRATLEALVAAVPMAETGHVVNNGAAALALVAAALATGREIIVARGELVEIGDGFRIPELLEASSAHLHEVGTTNRVRLQDYAEAVGDETGFVLKVHPSNFVVRGFTASVDVAELVGLGVPVVADIGSGLLRPHTRLSDEPDAETALGAGASLVTCSGDKLLGGPQCGLVLGKADLVQRVRRHPLARAYRVDKLTLAALCATLTGPPTPVQEALAREPGQLESRAEEIRAALPAELGAEVVLTEGCVGGGGAPEVTIPSVAVALDAALAPDLRRVEPAVVGRVQHDRLLIDLLAIDPGDDGVVVDLVRGVVGQARPRHPSPEP